MSGQQAAGRSGRASTSPGALSALLFFALLCGVALLLLGGGVSAPGVSASSPRLAPQLQTLSHQLQNAERALFSANYGECRDTLRAADQRLSQLLSQVRAAEESR